MRAWSCWSTAVTAAAAVAIAIVGVGAYRPGDETCVVGPDNACPLTALRPAATDGSTLVYPGGRTRCAFDDFTSPTGANFSTNATFFFQVFPNAQQDKSKLLLYLQGGGACVDNDTCNFELQCASPTQTFNTNARALSSGVLNRTDPRNAFRDWNIVHVPYCTGDIHVGNRTSPAAKSVFASLFPKPECANQNRSIHNNGFENAHSAFAWARANFPDVEHLALAGSSAGGLGAQLLSHYVAEMWGVQAKKIRYSVLADSYVGVVPEDKPASALINLFQACDVPSGLSAKARARCRNSTATVIEVISELIDQTPFSDWFFVDSKADKTQRLFYEMFKSGLLGYPFTNMISPEDFYANMTEILDAYKSESARVSTFFVEGDRHVFFTLPNWYDTPRAKTNESLGAAMRDILAGNYTAGGSSSQSGSRGRVTVPTPPASPAPGTLGVSSVLMAQFACLVSLLLW